MPPNPLTLVIAFVIEGPIAVGGVISSERERSTGTTPRLRSDFVARGAYVSPSISIPRAGMAGVVGGGFDVVD